MDGEVEAGQVVTSPRTVRPPVSKRPATAVLLVILGVGFCVLWKVASGTERHSYDRGAVPPVFVELTGGHSYAISIPGGVSAESDDGVTPDLLSCSVSGTGIGSRQLTLQTEQNGSKATDQIASFVSPVTGSVQVGCQQLPKVFVDDADDAGFDAAGLLLWLGVIALVVGVPLGLSVLRESVAVGDPVTSAGSARPGEDDEVE